MLVACTTSARYTDLMFERCLYFNVNALARSVNRIWTEAFKPYGLSPSHAYLVRLVLAQPGISPKEITAELKLEKSTVTRFIDALEAKSFLQRRFAQTEDAREQAIHPTKKAQKLAQDLEAQGNKLYQTMLSEIGSDKLKQLVQQLRETENRLS